MSPLRLRRVARKRRRQAGLGEERGLRAGNSRQRRGNDGPYFVEGRGALCLPLLTALALESLFGQRRLYGQHCRKVGYKVEEGSSED